MGKKSLVIMLSFSLVLMLVAMPLMTACEEEVTPPAEEEEEEQPPAEEEEEELPPDYDTRTSIVFGAARPISGPLATIGDYAMGPIMTLWEEDVNAKGGIYVEEYGRQLPIELKIEDDGSDLGMSQRLIEKLILEDEVDFLLPNCSTAFLYASAPLANKYEYVYLGAEGGCTTLTAMLPDLPYVFGVLNYSDYYQIPVLVDLFIDWGVETVAIIYINDLHGVEYYHTMLSELTAAGYDTTQAVVMAEAVPPYTEDVELVVKQAQDSGADVLCAFVYPPTTWAVPGQCMALGYNPNALVLGPGCCFQIFYDIFFGPATEGIIGFGAWNAKSSPALAEFAERFIERFGTTQGDWWGAAFYYAALQCFEQAIEKAGTLDNATVRDIMATEHFDTILGDTWFDMTAGGEGGGLLALECHPGQIGQWQSGIYEVIDPDEHRTAEPLYPKPAWP